MASLPTVKPPKPSPYITEPGFLHLQREAGDLWLRRREVTAALAAAAAEGDRSENAEYIYRKKELRELDRRIRYLDKRLPELKVIRERPNDLDKVFFGATVTLADEHGDTITVRIVGADEFDPKQGWISVNSPLAKALLGSTVDDDVRCQSPQGKRAYTVLGIDYPTPASGSQ